MTLSESQSSHSAFQSVGVASARAGVSPWPKPPSLHAVPITPVAQPVRVSASSRLVLPSPKSGRVGATISLSRPARASLALRPAGLLGHLTWPLSQGSNPIRCRINPLVSYQTHRLLSGRDFHPLVICAVGAHLIPKDIRACAAHRACRRIEYNACAGFVNRSSQTPTGA